MVNAKTIHSDKRLLKGLHRPFNKPLKSLYWVCRFVSSHPVKKPSSFYILFYQYLLKYVSSSDSQYEKSPIKEGMISPSDARIVCAIQQENPLLFEKRINGVLYRRENDTDRLLYKTYKNATYYIGLAKKMDLITSNYQLTNDGLRLIRSTNKMYLFTQAEQKLYFEWMLDADFELFVSLLLSSKYDDSLLYQRFLEQQGYNSYSTKYIRSYDKNYIEVLRSWIGQLNILTKNNSIRKCYIKEIERLDLLPKYNDIVVFFKAYQKNVEGGRTKIEKLFERFDDSYKTLVKKGVADVGFVNLYDIRDMLHMNYERFNSLLVEYYANRKNKHIILFSNTVSSIDTRRRFIIDNQVVLKIKLIQKNKSNGI